MYSVEVQVHKILPLLVCESQIEAKCNWTSTQQSNRHVKDQLDSVEPEVKEELDETIFKLLNENNLLVQSIKAKNEETLSKTLSTGQGQSASYATVTSEQSNYDINDHFQSLLDKLTHQTTGHNQLGNDGGGDGGELMNSTGHHQLHSAHLSQSVNEIWQPSTEPMLEDQEFAQSLSSSIVNEQSSQLNWDEEECDSDDDGIEQTVNEDDSFDWLDDNIELEQSSRPVKRARLDTAQQNNPKRELIGPECSAQSTQPNQVNNSHDKQIITLSLQCVHCSIAFDKDQLHDHIREIHFLSPYRCLVKDCGQFLNNKNSPSGHITTSHQHTSQWHCGICPKHFISYHHLSSHHNRQHQHGRFQCSFPACTFMGEYRVRVYNHYAAQHKHKATLTCQQLSGCNYRTSVPADMKSHERTHSGIKPYKCKWPHCDYAASRKNQTIAHICRHIAANFHSVSSGTQLDPKDYVEVRHDL